MATDELQRLRLAYTAAYEAYKSSVQAISDASQRGEWPSAAILSTEQEALNDLNNARADLMHAMFAHARATRNSK